MGRIVNLDNNQQFNFFLSSESVFSTLNNTDKGLTETSHKC